jgi:hypothetical protein
MIDEFCERPPKVTLAQRHDSIEALVFDRPHKPLGIGIRIGRLKRCLHDLHPALAEQAAHLPAPLPIAITEQDAMARQDALIRCRQCAADLALNTSLGNGVEPTICTRRDARSITNTV